MILTNISTYSSSLNWSNIIAFLATRTSFIARTLANPFSSLMQDYYTMRVCQGEFSTLTSNELHTYDIWDVAAGSLWGWLQLETNLWPQ